MDLFNDFLISLLKLSPVVGLLIIAIYYLYKENSKLKEKNEELNLYIREEGIKNVTILSQVTTTLDRVIDDANSNNQNLKEWLQSKFDILNGK